MSLPEVTAAQQPSPTLCVHHLAIRRHHRTASATTSPQATSLAKAIMIVYPHQTPAEGEYLAEGDQHRMVYLAQRRAAEPRDQQYPTKPAQTYC